LKKNNNIFSIKKIANQQKISLLFLTFFSLLSISAIIVMTPLMPTPPPPISSFSAFAITQTINVDQTSSTSSIISGSSGSSISQLTSNSAINQGSGTIPQLSQSIGGTQISNQQSLINSATMFNQQQISNNMRNIEENFNTFGGTNLDSVFTQAINSNQGVAQIQNTNDIIGIQSSFNSQPLQLAQFADSSITNQIRGQNIEGLVNGDSLNQIIEEGDQLMVQRQDVLVDVDESEADNFGEMIEIGTNVKGNSLSSYENNNFDQSIQGDQQIIESQLLDLFGDDRDSSFSSMTIESSNVEHNSGNIGFTTNNNNNNQQIEGLQTSSATQEMIDSFDSTMSKSQVNSAANVMRADDRDPPAPVVGNQDNTQTINVNQGINRNPNILANGLQTIDSSSNVLQHSAIINDLGNSLDINNNNNNLQDLSNTQQFSKDIQSAVNSDNLVQIQSLRNEGLNDMTGNSMNQNTQFSDTSQENGVLTFALDSFNTNQHVNSDLIERNRISSTNNDNFQSLRGFQFAEISAQTGSSANVMQNIDVVNALENILEGANNNQNSQDGGAQQRSLVSENSFLASNLNQDIEALMSAENKIAGSFNNNNRQVSSVTQDIQTLSTSHLLTSNIIQESDIENKLQNLISSSSNTNNDQMSGGIQNIMASQWSSDSSSGITQDADFKNTMQNEIVSDQTSDASQLINIFSDQDGLVSGQNIDSHDFGGQSGQVAINSQSSQQIAFGSNNAMNIIDQPQLNSGTVQNINGGVNGQKIGLSQIDFNSLSSFQLSNIQNSVINGEEPEKPEQETE
jgi:hypothetical protein